jgi:hypothetical protein
VNESPDPHTAAAFFSAFALAAVYTRVVGHSDVHDTHTASPKKTAESTSPYPAIAVSADGPDVNDPAWAAATAENVYVVRVLGLMKP